MFCIRHMSMASEQLRPHLYHLHQICLARALLLDPEYIPSRENTVPDRLSRCKGEEDLQLHPRIFQEITRKFGPRSIDRFASRANRLCSRFNSLHLDVGSAGQDAFLQDWSNERNWVNPPWTWLARLTAFLEARPHVEAVVLAPDWPSAVWFHRLLAIASEELRLPCRPAMFWPGNPARPAVLPPPRWNLQAFHIRPWILKRN